MNESPCASCKLAPFCKDDWYGCEKWNKYIRKEWKEVTNLFSDEPNKTTRFKYLALYCNGKNDREIAVASGVTQVAVCQWRQRNGLPPIGKRGRKPAIRIEAWKEATP